VALRRLARGRAALRGAVGFLTRVPLGHDQEDWTAFRSTLPALPAVGYPIGALLAVPIAAGMVGGLPPATAAVAFVAWCYLLTGITHLDGLADLGDAAAVHGEPEDRLAVLKDTAVGVGAVLAVGVVLLGLALAAQTIATRPLLALGLVIAAEVGAKLGIAVVAALGRPATDGLGAQLADPARPASLTLPALVAAPAALLTWPSPAAAVALVAPVAVAVSLWWWARATLGGVNGDVMGAANELGRAVALHAGVVAWTLS